MLRMLGRLSRAWGWLMTIIGWLVIALFGMNFVQNLWDVGRSWSLSKKWLHSCSGCASLAAIAVLWTRWNWPGISLAIAIKVGTTFIFVFMARLWLVHLLNTSPEAADAFMRDP